MSWSSQANRDRIVAPQGEPGRRGRLAEPSVSERRLSLSISDLRPQAAVIATTRLSAIRGDSLRSGRVIPDAQRCCGS